MSLGDFDPSQNNDIPIHVTARRPPVGDMQICHEKISVVSVRPAIDIGYRIIFFFIPVAKTLKFRDENIIRFRTARRKYVTRALQRGQIVFINI